MIVFVTFLCFLASSCNARPNNINPQNVITVPTNCPDGQEWVNGACREIWRFNGAPANLVTVPTNCPPGQSFVNGQCRDVWNKALLEESDLSLQNIDYFNIGYKGGQVENNEQSEVNNRHLISVPHQCPEGYRPDALGNCRPIFVEQ